MVTAETEGRVGKIAGERARTREAKLDCVFTQSSVDGKGRPVRDQASTTYSGATETAEEFGVRLYHEAWQRGWCRAKRKVVLGDGAPWIWNLADYHFPGATQIANSGDQTGRARYRAKYSFQAVILQLLSVMCFKPASVVIQIVFGM
jgi:hypothetical protein